MKRITIINKTRGALKRFAFALAASAAFLAGSAQAATIWIGPPISFTKADGADWTLPENQDRITPNVWITRTNSMQIFNIKIEAGPSGWQDGNGASPLDTEWAAPGAFGNSSDYSQFTARNYAALKYGTFELAGHGVPPNLVGEPVVLHLISEDIYLDVQFVSWTAGAGGGTPNGGGFSYTRGTWLPAGIVSFGLPGNPAVITGTDIALTVPYGTAVTNLKPTYTLTSGTCSKANGGPTGYDFTSPVTYTVIDGATTHVYTVTVTQGPASTACDITSFGANVAGSDAEISDPSSIPGTVAWTVPYGATPTALAPTYTLSVGATCVPAPGTMKNFTSPQTYTVTAQDGITTKEYTVTATVAPNESALTWNTTDGSWDLGSPNWTGQTSGSTVSFFTTANVIFTNNPAGGTITISPNMRPHSTTVSATSGTFTFSGAPVATGSLVKSGGGTLSLEVTPANFSSIAVTGGTLYLHAADHYEVDGASFNMGTGTVTVETGATVMGERAYMAGSLIMNGGRYFENNGFAGSWTGPVRLAADSFFGQNGWCQSQTINGEISGPGGFTFSTGYGAVLTLSVSNSYAGPTIVTSGTVKCDKRDALGSGALSISTGGAKVNLNYTGEHNVAALTLGGVAQTSGTYGSTASPATTKNDTYFAGTGMVRVPASSLNNMLTFSFGALGAATINGTNITMLVPGGTDVTHLAPT